jgi:hypothetical protein
MTVPIALARSVRQTLRGHDVAATSTTITVVQDR